jgi:hypothetical protein
VDFASLKQCTELRDAHIISAVASSEAMESLLGRFAEIAAPGKGAPILLAALARLGTTACTWIDGELRIEISGDATQTKIVASSSIGAGFREKLFRDTILRVPLEEFSRGLARAPRLIEPLKVQETGKRIVLTVTQEVRRTSLPPPMVQIDPTSLMMLPRMGVPTGVEPDVLPMPVPPGIRPATKGETAGKIVLRRRVKSGPSDPKTDPKK